MENDKNQRRTWFVLGILAIVYTLIVFVLPFRKNAVFYASYCFTLLAIAAQIYTTHIAFFKGEGIKSKFYGFPIVKIGAFYLIIQFVLGLLFMALGAFVPFWLPFVLYVLLLGAIAVGLIAADAVREEVERQDVKLQKHVSKMRAFQAKTKGLAEQCQIQEAKQALQELAEAFRFSDPVSNDSERMKELENKLEDDLAALQDAAALLKVEETLGLCQKTRADLAERNRICKGQKSQ